MEATRYDSQTWGIDTELALLPAIADSMPESRGSLRDLDAFLHDVRTEM